MTAVLEREPTTSSYRAPSRPRLRPPRDLPAWPLYAAFAAFPVWWRLGLGSFIWAIVAIPMAVYLVYRGRVRAPRGFGLWLLFIFWVCAGALTNVHGLGHSVALVIRLSTFAAGAVFLLYIYNARDNLRLDRVSFVLSLFWLSIVAGGYLGMLFPRHSFGTPLAHLLPRSFADNSLVQETVHPVFSEFNRTTPGLHTRPSAPFAYTNSWGCNYALLVPFVFIALHTLRRGPWRVVLIVALPLSLVPAFYTLNRGMFISLGAAMLYVALRLGARGHHRALLGVVVFLVVVGVVVAVLPVQQLLTERVSQTHTNSTRLALYSEAWQRTLESPVVGYGNPVYPADAPQGLQSINGKLYPVPPVGTQGQVWFVLVSSGLPGAAFFLGWFVWAFWRTRRFRDVDQLWLHAVVFIDLIQFWYYGVGPSDLCVLMVAIGFGLRLRLSGGEPGTPGRGAVPSAQRHASTTSSR